jgi:hypothetical protein
MEKKKHGGTRANSGRKSKAEEQSLVDKLKPIDPIARRVLQNAVNGGEKWAVELFFKYFYGLPTQVIDQTINTEDNEIRIEIVKAKKDDNTSN